MTASRPRYSREETAQRGQEIYERDIRPVVEAAHWGEFAAINIVTGTYALDKDDYSATETLLARQPEAQIWLVRVGHASTYRIGGAALHNRAEGGMIIGVVNSYHEATIRLPVQSDDERQQEITATRD